MNCIKVAYIVILVAFSAIGSSCLRKDVQQDNSIGVLARVGDQRLVIEDLEGVFYEGITKEDSIKLLSTIVESWINKQLKIQHAKTIKIDKTNDIEKKVAEYRNLLLIHQCEQEYINQHVDTLVTDSQIEFYYQNSDIKFMLFSPIVKCCLLKFPIDFRQGRKLGELLKSKRENDWLDLVDMADKNNLTLEKFDSWTEVSYLKSLLPKDADLSALGEFAGKKKNVMEITDKRYKYLIRIDQFIDAGNKQPLEQVRSVIRKMIIHQRSQNEIKFMEDSLLSTARKDGAIFINVELKKNASENSDNTKK